MIVLMASFSSTYIRAEGRGQSFGTSIPPKAVDGFVLKAASPLPAAAASAPYAVGDECLQQEGADAAQQCVCCLWPWPPGHLRQH